MHSTARVIALLAVLSCAASAARAQYPQRRDGFWIGFGLGYGSANITCDNCADSSSVGSITGFVKLGGAPSRNLLIGGAINGWWRTNEGMTETIGNVTASVYLSVPRHEERILRHRRSRVVDLSRKHVSSVRRHR